MDMQYSEFIKKLMKCEKFNASIWIDGYEELGYSNIWLGCDPNIADIPVYLLNFDYTTHDSVKIYVKKFKTLGDLMNSNVFDNKSLLQLWGRVHFYHILRHCKNKKCYECDGSIGDDDLY